MKRKTYYRALPLNLRKKLRHRRECEIYRTFVREMTKFDMDSQVEAETEYLKTENRLMYNKLTDNDRVLLDVPPECFVFLGELAEKLPPDERDAVAIMTYEQLMRGYHHYKEKPPRRRIGASDLDIEHLVTTMAMQNVTWGMAHIHSMLRALGLKEVTKSRIESILRRNKIPNTRDRTNAGISWRDFIENLKNPKIKGVIIK